MRWQDYLDRAKWSEWQVDFGPQLGAKNGDVRRQKWRIYGNLGLFG
jgi:hypothetical protein